MSHTTSDTALVLPRIKERRLLKEYVTQQEDVFLRVFDKDREEMQAPWVHHYNLTYGRSDAELSGYFAHLNFASPTRCDVLVPTNTKIKCWGSNNSSIILLCELDMACRPEFKNERALPKTSKLLKTEKEPHVAFDFVLDHNSIYSTLYDKQTRHQENNWLFNREAVLGKSPEQLQKEFHLQFVPKFICDVVVLKNQRLVAWIMPGTTHSNVVQFNGLRQLGQERELK